MIIIIRQSRRTFVEKLDFVSSVGYLDGPGDRERLGLTGKGPSLVITDLGLLRPRPSDLELELTHLHPGVTLEQGPSGYRLGPGHFAGAGPYRAAQSRRAGRVAQVDCDAYIQALSTPALMTSEPI